MLIGVVGLAGDLATARWMHICRLVVIIFCQIDFNTIGGGGVSSSRGFKLFGSTRTIVI